MSQHTETTEFTWVTTRDRYKILRAVSLAMKYWLVLRTSLRELTGQQAKWMTFKFLCCSVASTYQYSCDKGAHRTWHNNLGCFTHWSLPLSVKPKFLHNARPCGWAPREKGEQQQACSQEYWLQDKAPHDDSGLSSTVWGRCDCSQNTRDLRYGFSKLLPLADEQDNQLHPQF